LVLNANFSSIFEAISWRSFIYIFLSVFIVGNPQLVTLQLICDEWRVIEA